MTNAFASTSGLAAAPLSAALTGANPAVCIADAARILLPHLERGQRIDAAALRAAMEIRLWRLRHGWRLGLEDRL